jgi:DNA-binding NtrC family response regulator
LNGLGKPDSGSECTLNVLLAVLDADERELIRRMLLRSGCHVITSLGGRCEPDDADPVDVLVTEVNPEFDGRALVERVRASRPGLPAVFVTGWFDHPDFHDFRCGPIVKKPFSRAALMREVNAALEADHNS